MFFFIILTPFPAQYDIHGSRRSVHIIIVLNNQIKQCAIDKVVGSLHATDSSNKGMHQF